jgi:hypothetical protein
LSWAVEVGMIDPAQYAEPAPLFRSPTVELWRADRR